MFRKYALILLVCFMMCFIGCGKVEEEGTLYTRDDIFIDCIKIDYPGTFTSKLLIIEDDNSLTAALEMFPKLRSMPRFEEIMDTYPIENYTYVVEFDDTMYISETITCDGIIVNKESNEIRFKTNIQKKKNDRSEAMAGYIVYAVFPKEELQGCDFAEQEFVLYPGRE